MTTLLVTGGAGFVGSHTVDLLVERGYRVRVMDQLDPQVHGPGHRWPSYRNPRAEYLLGDVRLPADWDRALDGVGAVIHLAAAVGVGQSMYEIHRYVEVNVLGTALLLDKLARRRPAVKKLIVASSMSIYGEGAYTCRRCGPVVPGLRRLEHLRARAWEMPCLRCGAPATPAPTPEQKRLQPTSVYAVTKRDQEDLCLVVGPAYGIPVVALRYFNIYGPRQALSNPYTGVVAIFSSRLLNGQPPMVFEDGRQSRDFIHVHDVARANLLALETSGADGQVVNVGTGRALSLLTVCDLLGRTLGRSVPPTITGKFREGDVRHCVADPSRAARTLNFHPTIPFEEGLQELVAWVRSQPAQDRVGVATAELARKGLLR